MWTFRVQHELEKIYGINAPELNEFPSIPDTLPSSTIRETSNRKLEQLNRIIEDLEILVKNSVTPLRGKRIFIGHGHSPMWLLLKDFIENMLGLPSDEFNRESVAGITTTERLQTMLSQAAFAFLIMTAEEEYGDTTLHARPNVIHDVGLFQGRLGLRRAIVMVEDGCSEFSNIHGLGDIRFPRSDIGARFEQVRQVLEREKII